MIKEKLNDPFLLVRENFNNNNSQDKINKEQFKKIISGYKSAPINQLYKPEMYLDLGKCTIEINILDKFHHSARSLHGSVYFKMLDDAAWGASNTYVKDVFLFTYKSMLKFPVSLNIA